MLAGATLLKHLPQYTRQQYLALNNISNNFGLITRLTSHNTYTSPYLNATLAPNWDLTEEIYQTMHHLQINTQSYEWVRGHQDRRVPFKRLDQEAKYNVRADELANSAMAALHTGHIISPILPHTGCYLNIGKHTCSGHYVPQLSVPTLIHAVASENPWLDNQCHQQH